MHGITCAPEMGSVGWWALPNCDGAPMFQTFLACKLLSCKAWVASTFQGSNSGLGRVVVKPESVTRDPRSWRALRPTTSLHTVGYARPQPWHIAGAANGLLSVGGEDLLSHQAGFSQHLPVRALAVSVQPQRDVLCRPGGQVLQVRPQAGPDPLHPLG